MLSFISSFFKGFFQSFYTVYNLIRYGEQYVMKDLTDEAMNGKGYVIKTLFGIRNIVVLTGKDFVTEGVVYGEFARNKDTYDDKARKPLDTASLFIGVDSLINWHGDIGIHAERKAIQKHMMGKGSGHSITQVSHYHFNELVNNWPNDKSIEKITHKICASIIAETMFGLPRNTIDEKYYSLVAEAEHEIFSHYLFVSPRLKTIQKELKRYNDQYVKEFQNEILQTESYSKYLVQHTSYPERKLEDWNPIGSLIAAGNLSSLLTGIIVKLAENPALQEKLRQELLKAKLDEVADPDQFFKILHALPLLEGIYKEGLRFFSISPPVVRYVSKPAKINNVDIPAGSYILIPLSRILTDKRCTWDKGGSEKHWKNPEEFNPERDFPPISKYPLIPFSHGVRSCAAQFSMVEQTIKIGLAILIAKNRIVFNQPQSTVEKIERYNFATRLKQEYQCDLIPLDEIKEQEKDIICDEISPQLLHQYQSQNKSTNDEKVGSNDKSISKTKSRSYKGSN